MSKLESLTRGQRVVLALSVVTLLLGFWLSGSRGPASDTAAIGVDTLEGTEAGSAQSVPIVVHVVGAVPRPGVYTLPSGSRVRDAIHAAGGFSPDARPDSINLAAYCEDGDQISVQAVAPPPQTPPYARVDTSAPPPAPAAEPQVEITGPVPPAPQVQARRNAPESAVSQTPGMPEFAQTRPPEQVRLNHAGLEELQEIPGVGPELAQRIIYYRHLHGPFRGREDLQKVSGIGPSTADNILLSATLD